MGVAEKVTNSAVWFGDCLQSQGDLGTDKRFTGQRLDNTGLYYYNARYYDPTIGRFISADTIVPDATNPQSYNRYSYVFNNPLAFVDPTGHWPNWSGIWSGIKNTAQNVWDGLTVGYNEVKSFNQNPVGYSTEKLYSIPPIQNSLGIKNIEHYVDKNLTNQTIRVYDVSDNGLIGQTLDIIGASGISIAPYGVVVCTDGRSTQEINELKKHESKHYQEQSTWTTALWLIDYYGEMVVDWAYYGGNYWEGPYNMNSREVAARNYAGQPSHPYNVPTPWWEPIKNTFIQNTNNIYGGNTLWDYLGW